MEGKTLGTVCGLGRRQEAVSRETGSILTFHGQVQQLFNEVFEGWGVDVVPLRVLSAELTACTPRVDVSETDQHIRVYAELPGMEEKDIQVTLADDLLTIRGEKRADQEHQDAHVRHIEQSYGTFQRSMIVPAEVDQGRVTASFKQGVLTVALPKTAAARQQARTIPVKTG